jgi:hypothetical protein
MSASGIVDMRINRKMAASAIVDMRLNRKMSASVGATAIGDPLADGTGRPLSPG